MAKKNNKIPGAVVGLIIIVIVGIIFIPTVYMPYSNKKPQMDADHQAALEEIQYYEDSIANQATIEKNISELQTEWDAFQKEMFIDASSSLADIEAAVRATDFYLTSFVKSEGQPDPNGAVSFTGSPLYYQQITISGYSDQETLIEILKFIEEESVGCYYVKQLQSTTMVAEQKVGSYTVKEGDLLTNMTVYLYYYNQALRVEPTVESDTDAVS